MNVLNITICHQTSLQGNPIIYYDVSITNSHALVLHQETSIPNDSINKTMQSIIKKFGLTDHSNINLRIEKKGKAKNKNVFLKSVIY